LLLNINNLKKILILSVVSALFTGCSVGQKRYYSYNSSSSGKSYNSSSTNSRVNTTTNYNTTGKSYDYNDNVRTDIKNSKAMHRATMRPYTVLGKRYHPTIAHIGDEFKGVASWYGPDFHAKKTSNGEIYNMYAMTAAHKTLPMNTVVKVENLENGLSCIVRVNDRGPFVKQRIIDLSNVAAHKIDMVKKGTARVKLTVLGFNGKIAQTLEEKKETASVSNYYLQVGVFSRQEGANATKRKFEMILDDKYSVILKDSTLNEKKVKRVWISGFGSEEEAMDFKENNNLVGSMVIAQ
jgi:rare lipoprotein A